MCHSIQNVEVAQVSLSNAGDDRVSGKEERLRQQVLLLLLSTYDLEPTVFREVMRKIRVEREVTAAL